MKVSGPMHSQVILKIVKFAEQKEDVLFCFTLRMKNKSLDLSRQCQYSVTITMSGAYKCRVSKHNTKVLRGH